MTHIRVSCLVLALASCAAPTLDVATEPANSEIRIDGEPVGIGRADLGLPYYGVIQIEAAAPPDADPPLAANMRSVTVAEPVTPWIFPFDFFGEVLTYPWRTEPAVEIRLEPRPRLRDGEQPEGTAELSRRAHRARIER